MNVKAVASICSALGLIGCVVACGGGGSATSTPGPPAVAAYTLVVSSTNPGSGVAIVVTPADNSGQSNGASAFSRTYNAGTDVTLTAPAVSGAASFSAWSGCTSATTLSCHVTMNANVTVTAAYSPVTSVTVSPGPVTLNVGTTQGFVANVAGAGTFDRSVTWAVNGVVGGSAADGTISATGLYVTPFPVPASITVTATSVLDPAKSGSATVSLVIPTAAGPALSVDAAAQTHPISPLIYGMNAYQLNAQEAKDVRLSLDRWGGDATTRYNYLRDVTNSAGDWYFETNPNSNTNYPDISDFNTQATVDHLNQTKTLGTVPLIGWTTKRPTGNVRVCGFSVSKYGAQQKTDPYAPDCGNGVKPDGSNLTGNDPADTSIAVDESFVKGWVQYLVKKFGNAASGGVAIYDLDNEPEWWAGVHRDVHPLPMTYDELTNKGLSYAKAVKDADPTAEVSGPVISYWMDFFYSFKDITSGWGSGPDYVANGNPVDRIAHNNIPLMDYYLQAFKKNEDTTGVRLLDYLDIHTYFAAPNAGFNPAGATDLQRARLDSTRVFWDPTYTDPTYTDPENRTKSAQPVPPQLIPRLKNWVANDYPGTKTAITEYNWGAQEHINGALAQADILGIFGREGLDLGTLWGPPDPVSQKPGLLAFELFRNYDGADGSFGDIALTASSTDQGQLSVYAALRSADNKVTVLVLNKSFSNLTSTLSLANLSSAASAQVYRYSSANLNAIVSLPDITVASPSPQDNLTALSQTFPAQSITLFVLPR